jgi:hypothetical protein
MITSAISSTVKIGKSIVDEYRAELSQEFISAEVRVHKDPRFKTKGKVVRKSGRVGHSRIRIITFLDNSESRSSSRSEN